MRILVLGGTAFLSAAIARSAARTHDVTCAARGTSGEPPEAATFVRWDRNQPVPEGLVAGGFDAVVDVSGSPSHVRAAVAAFPTAHWVFVSTISVYSDLSVPGGGPDDTPLLAPEPDDTEASPETYGGRKVACEAHVREGATRATILRPGLIVGPGDASGRFAHWPSRLRQASLDGKPYLAPLPMDDPAQWIDARDLADWTVRIIEDGTTGTFDAIGQPVPRSQFLSEVGDGVGAHPDIEWAEPDRLLEQGVGFWAGPGAIPMWVPLPEYAGMMDRDHAPAQRAGLSTRALAETAADVLAWVDGRDLPMGLTRQDELTVIAGGSLTGQE